MIISIVAKLINTFATTLQNVLLLASCTGKFIISIIAWITTNLLYIFNSIVLFFQIVYEDNVSIFTEDIPASANGMVDAVFTQIMYIQSSFSEVCNGIYFEVYAIITSVRWLLQAVFVILSEVLYLVKNTVILLGDTMWLMVTFLPIHLPQLLRMVFKDVGTVIINIVVDGYMSLLKFTNYLTEVPLQSFMGIISMIIIVRLCVHFKETILTQMTLLYWKFIRNTLYLYYVILDYFTTSEDSAIRAVAEDVATREDYGPSEVDDVANAAESLCVICQERQKCVLTLPCRHVCLCADCCRRLYGYQRTCPICRTFIYHSVTVYL